MLAALTGLLMPLSSASHRLSFARASYAADAHPLPSRARAGDSPLANHRLAGRRRRRPAGRRLRRRSCARTTTAPSPASMRPGRRRPRSRRPRPPAAHHRTKPRQPHTAAGTGRHPSRRRAGGGAATRRRRRRRPRRRAPGATPTRPTGDSVRRRHPPRAAAVPATSRRPTTSTATRSPGSGRGAVADRVTHAAAIPVTFPAC